MIKISKVYPRDIIAFFVLMFSLVLIAKGINAIVSGIVIMIVTYYFTQRSDEELHPENDLGKRVLKVEEKINGISKTPQIPSKFNSNYEPPDHGKYDYDLKTIKP